MYRKDCCKCYEPIPIARIKALPNTKECVKCSSVERNMVRAVITGKTTYSEIEVIKNKETKEYLNNLIGKGRRGFGSMLHRSTGSDSTSTKTKLGSRSSRILRMPTKEDFDKVGKQVMYYLDLEMPERANRVMQTALECNHITGIQFRQLKEIIKHIDNG